MLYIYTKIFLSNYNDMMIDTIFHFQKHFKLYIKKKKKKKYPKEEIQENKISWDLIFISLIIFCASHGFATSINNKYMWDGYHSNQSPLVISVMKTFVTNIN